MQVAADWLMGTLWLVLAFLLLTNYKAVAAIMDSWFTNYSKTLRVLQGR